MSEPLSKTLHEDAPLSAAKHPDPQAAAVPGVVDESDALVGRTVTVNRPRQDVYDFWRDFKNLPRFMHEIRQIDVVDRITSRWTVEAPAGRTVQWESLVTREIPGELIEWESSADASIRNSGRVEFRDAPAGRGTEVTATIVYHAPGGSLGTLVAKLFQKEPKIQARRDLRRFKQLMETGEVATAEPPRAAPRAG